MVVRTRLHRAVRLLVLYAGAAAAIAYFGFHAFSGDHGIMAQRHYTEQKAALTTELAALQNERERLEKQLALLKSDSIDPDILEEKARSLLGMTHPDDVIVMVGP